VHFSVNQMNLQLNNNVTQIVYISTKQITNN
jgi:hypothetical protein